MDLGALMDAADRAAALLKVLANADRLLILCQLAAGEKTVTELGTVLNLRQPTLSQQLARLRADGLVDTRRDGKNIFYSLTSPAATRIMEVLYEVYCTPEAVNRPQARPVPALEDRD